jgi:hypothetical protein
VHTNENEDDPNGKLPNGPKPKPKPKPTAKGGGKGVRKESKDHYSTSNKIV